MEPLVPSLLGVFPDIRRLEVNGWNDLAEMDRLAPPAIGFDVSFVNTFVLASSEEEQRARLEAVAPLRRRRQVAVCAQAMVKLRSYEDTFARMNRFVELAREVLA
jgi:hypothetical protein